MTIAEKSRIRGNKNYPGTHYDFDVHTIRWDPRAAMRVTCGGIQTSAIGLLHELGHADINLNGWYYTAQERENFKNGIFIYDAFTLKEERRNILNIEDKVAQELREPQRFEHSGIPVRSCSAISVRLCGYGN